MSGQAKPPPASFKGICRSGDRFPPDSCNGKIVGARLFARAGQASGEFNATIHYASPYDPDGHGSHTASIAAGNFHTPAISRGYNFGYASREAWPPELVYLQSCLSFWWIHVRCDSGRRPASTPGKIMYPLALADDVSIANSTDGSANCQDPEDFTRSLAQGKVIICMYVPSNYYEGDSLAGIVDTIQKIGAVGVVITDHYLGDIDIEYQPSFLTAVPSAIVMNGVDTQVGVETNFPIK